MSIYDELGLKRIINADATLTSLGGSLMPRPVLAAMMEAASAFVDMAEFQRRVGEEIAAMTLNEAAFVTTGANAGVVLSVAACMTGLDPAKRARLPNTDGMKNEVIVQHCAFVAHEFGIQAAGGKIVSIGTEDFAVVEELEGAINDRTAAVFIVPKGDGPHGMIPIPDVIRVAHDHGVPVIVDAAAQLPPVENLFHFTKQLGADIAIFSGGKGLSGPQSTGLILGRKDLIDACAFQASPNVFIGRPFKVGKEELAGIYAAVKHYISLDHDAVIAEYERVVAYVIDELSRAQSVTATRDFPSEAGQPMPRAKILIDEQKLGITRNEIRRALRDETPRIELAPTPEPNGLFLNPQTLREGEEKVVTGRLLRIILTRELEQLRRSQQGENA
ncbi:MAG: aminotransferase class V-fold PLP-dependent enzyme [Candidatus Poribacteria bacterium]|nr:aminotransferase class V-fold PLP-dependent enzyme [Candidatus Poribacteria bacterium]